MTLFIKGLQEYYCCSDWRRLIKMIILMI